MFEEFRKSAMPYIVAKARTGLARRGNSLSYTAGRLWLESEPQSARLHGYASNNATHSSRSIAPDPRTVFDSFS